MSYIKDLSSLRQLRGPLPSSYEIFSGEENRSQVAMQTQLGVIAAHMMGQLLQHNEAMANTNVLFNQVLEQLEPVCECFRESFAHQNVPGSRFFSQIDSDRSVGILNILWHAISFTTRGNTKPLALHRVGREPLFTGRIIALHGDFQDVSSELHEYEYPELLQFEIASLYVPADITAPAVMKVKHLGNEEQYIHQADAPRAFLMKTVEVICGGGFFHEKES